MCDFTEEEALRSAIHKLNMALRVSIDSARLHKARADATEVRLAQRTLDTKAMGRVCAREAALTARTLELEGEVSGCNRSR